MPPPKRQKAGSRSRVALRRRIDEMSAKVLVAGGDPGLSCQTGKHGFEFMSILRTSHHGMTLTRPEKTASKKPYFPLVAVAPGTR